MRTRPGVLVALDTVTSLAGVPVEIDAWGIDAVYSGTQKCLSCPPGLAPVSFGPKAVEVITSRKSKVQSWYLDMNMIERYWGSDRFYHHTAPINMNYALREALKMVAEEGLEAGMRGTCCIIGHSRRVWTHSGLELVPPEGYAGCRS